MIDSAKLLPDLETERLYLKAIHTAHLDFIFKHFSDASVNQFLYDEEPVSSIDEAKEIIDFYMNPDVKGANRWVIVRKDNGLPIGTCGFHCWERKNMLVEIGYDLGKEHWGYGYMTEALTAAINCSIEYMDINRIQAFVSVDNKKSCRVLERLGFKKEGIIRDKHFFRGNFYDHFCFSLLKTDWTQLNS